MSSGSLKRPVVFLLCLLWATSVSRQQETYDYYDDSQEDDYELDLGNVSSRAALFQPIATHEGFQRALKLRHLLKEEWRLFPEAYDIRDIDYVLNGSLWRVTRFMVDDDREEDLDSILSRMTENLEWRHSMGINEDKPSEVWPCEFWLTGTLHLTVPRSYEDSLKKKQRQVSPRWMVIHDIARMVGYDGELGREWTRFNYWQFDQIDRLAGWDTWEMIISLSGLQWWSMPNSEMISQFLPFAERFTGKLNRVYVDRSGMEQMSLLSAAVGGIIAVTPRQTNLVVQSLSSDADVYRLVKKRNLPNFMSRGGLPVSKSLLNEVLPDLSDGPLRVSPLKDCRNLEDFTDWPAQEVEKFLRNNEDIIQYNADQIGLT